MKGVFRFLNFGGGSQDDRTEGSSTSSKSRHRYSYSEASSCAPLSESNSPSSDSHTSSTFSGWLNVAKQTLHQGNSPNQKIENTSPNHKKENTNDQKDEVSNSRHTVKEGINCRKENEEYIFSTTPAFSGSSRKVERRSSDPIPGNTSAVYKDAQDITIDRVQRAALKVASDQALFLRDEEYQIRVALALSVHDDPEATAIENAKDLSLGSELSLSNSTAEVQAYRYWRYDVLKYNDRVADGFYDVYCVTMGLSSETMPTLTALQETPVSDQISWEVVIVNRATDSKLVSLEQKAISILSSFRARTGGLKSSGLASRIATVVADQMGGPVSDEALLLKRWRSNSAELRASEGNVVLPLGHLKVGLGRHRALLFKVLADAVGIPCQLLKSKQYTGSDEGAVNIIKIETGREFIIDLMGAPGTLLPSDGINSFEKFNSEQEALNLEDMAVSALDVLCSPKDSTSGLRPLKSNDVKLMERAQSGPTVFEPKEMDVLPVRSDGIPPVTYWRSPSWTEGISSPDRDMKVKDVSEYMLNAAKENPNLAQKLHDVLVESGVKAPPDLFGEISSKQLKVHVNEYILDEEHLRKVPEGVMLMNKEKITAGPGWPPAPEPSRYSPSAGGDQDKLDMLNSVADLGERQPMDCLGVISSPNVLTSSLASSRAFPVQPAVPILPPTAAISLVQETLPPELVKKAPVSAAAEATDVVVASSMVASASKEVNGANPTLEVPVMAATTATAAVVVATPDFVDKQMDTTLAEPIVEVSKKDDVKNFSDSNKEGQGSGGADKWFKEDSVSDKPTGWMSSKSNQMLDDVAELEIPWGELEIGDRIGIGSYGEVYHGNWHGTEVAVKKFLEQGISGDALEEFRSEVKLMKRLRHPNVVLFMGAVMRAPNLSIVTEFLPRASLHRLIHRSNVHLDERRRMRMALDVARGMNYLHNCTPVIVHRDLKSPNLLVDKNWVVKVCDFGLSRLKHTSFLSTKSTAGTPEWMAPEVIRNEPCNEKSDVYSFGVVLWELATLQQPWAGMNSMQVVGAVGFQERTLDIPENLDPAIVKIIRQCWQSNPASRPSFTEIMAALKPLQMLITPARSAKA